jgi:putative endonuclease
MYTVYVLKSLKDNKLYVGQTNNLENRLTTHNEGKALSTKNRRPWILVYSENVETRSMAMRKERYFKSGSGREWLKRHQII